jgi:hypothetical protein
MSKKILITGDYTHRDFKNLVTGIDAVILAPFNEALQTSTALCSELGLVVIAQSFPGQFSATEIEKLQGHFQMVPVIAVLGSWCEGETRSGKPWPGVVRVYWHQWLGRIDLFRRQLETANFTLWHQPATSTLADRVLRFDKAQPLNTPHQRKVGISANTSGQAEMLEDVLKELGFASFWIELASDQQPNLGQPDLICVDANQLGQPLKLRLDWLSDKFSGIPRIVFCNFPRANEVEELMSWNVSRIVSKPFELQDVASAIKSALDTQRI